MKSSSSTSLDPQPDERSMSTGLPRIDLVVECISNGEEPPSLECGYVAYGDPEPLRFWRHRISLGLVTWLTGAIEDVAETIAHAEAPGGRAAPDALLLSPRGQWVSVGVSDASMAPLIPIPFPDGTRLLRVDCEFGNVFAVSLDRADQLRSLIEGPTARALRLWAERDGEIAVLRLLLSHRGEITPVVDVADPA